MSIIGLLIGASLLYWAYKLYTSGNVFWAFVVGLIGISVGIGGFYVKVS